MKEKIDRYILYNRSRKIKAIGFNDSKATLLFKIIPFLLHSNYPSLPGFVDSAQCPHGIHKFIPDKIVSPVLFKRYFPTSSALKENTPSPFSAMPCIYSLKTIGSIGTIAQTEKSDCDYWVSIRYEELGPTGLSMLEQKCKAIEQWAMKRGAEIHFFLMDIDQTRENSFESRAEEESAGSALKLLLKDELFRTHILVAGKMLLWWLIPPGLSEEEYKSYVDTLIAGNEISPDNFIDLGYISDIPEAEIFGASLWQMNQALDSPFKSVIKFAYLELLHRGHSQSLPLFSDKVKCLVTFPDQLSEQEKEEVKLADVDPYLLLAREIVAFYQNQNQEPDQRRANLIRECLFLKTLEGVASQKKSANSGGTLRSIFDLMQKWKLLPENSSHLLKMTSWSTREMIDFGTKVHDYLVETYNRLSRLFKTLDGKTTLTITQRDISVLGRKLFTFYQKKKNKIEYVRSLSREAMSQDNITFHCTRGQRISIYHALQGIHDNMPTDSEVIIHRDTVPVSLLAWLIVNGVLSENSRLHLTKNFHPFALSDLQSLASTMLRIFPRVSFADISAQPLVQKEVIVKALAVVNMTKGTVRGSDNLDSSIVYTNSYGEYFIQHFSTLRQLKKNLHDLLTKHYVSRWNNNLEFFIPPQADHHYIQTLLFK